MILLEEATKKEFWDKIRNDETYKIFRDAILKVYKEIDDITIHVEKYSEYRRFAEIGDRVVFDQNHGFVRDQLNVYAILALIYPEESSYLDKLQDVIWAICNEYSWAPPEHIEDRLHYDIATIDLSASWTGASLAEIKYLLKDRLAPIVVERIEAALKERIIEPYKKRQYFWEHHNNNWVGVCVSGVAITLLIEAPEVFTSQKERLDKTVQCYINSYHDDGACVEGPGYWNYGFGNLVVYFDLLRQFTDGKYNYFLDTKIKKIASFVDKIFLQDNVCAAFGDCSSNETYSLDVQHILCSVYGDEMKKMPLSCASIYQFQFPRMIAALINYKPEYVAPKLSDYAQYYMPDAQWFTKRTPVYGFAVRGGRNDDSHNHNDIGSFIIARNNKQILCELGSGLYTRQYFESEYRYTFLCNSSRGHSVPLINGCEQTYIHDKSGSMAYKDNTVSVDITNAYDVVQLKSFVRSFSLEEKVIHLHDEFECSLPVIDRFVSFEKPQTKNGAIYIDCIKLSFDASKMNAVIKKDSYLDHEGEMTEVYFTDFTPAEGIHDFNIDFVML